MRSPLWFSSPLARACLTWLTVPIFPLLVWIPSSLSLHYGRRIDELLLGSSEPWGRNVVSAATRIYAIDFVKEPNSNEEVIGALEGGRSVVGFGCLAIGALAIGEAWMEHGGTCYTTVGPIEYLDAAATFDSLFLLVIYLSMGNTIRTKRQSRQRRCLEGPEARPEPSAGKVSPSTPTPSPLQHETRPQRRASSFCKDLASGDGGKKHGPNFLLNTLLIGNTLMILTSTHCKERLKYTALYLAPVLFVSWVLLRGRPCHLMGASVGLTFVFTPACLFRLGAGLQASVHCVALTALGYAIAVLAHVLWARRMYEKIGAAGRDLRNWRRGSDGGGGCCSRSSFAWQNLLHLAVIFFGLVIMCFPNVIGVFGQLSATTYSALKETVFGGHRSAADFGKVLDRRRENRGNNDMGGESIMAAQTTNSIVDNLHLRPRTRTLLVGHGGEAGRVLMVFGLALLQPAIAFLCSKCSCKQLKLQQVIPPAMPWVHPRRRSASNRVLLLGSIVVAALTITRDHAASHSTAAVRLVMLAPPLCGGLVGLIGFVEDELARRSPTSKYATGTSLLVCRRLCEWVSPLPLCIYPLAQAVKAAGGCALFGKPFLVDEIFVLADHDGFLMVLILTMLLTTTVHILLQSPPWRIVAQGLSSYFHFKVSVAYQLDDVKGAKPFSDLAFFFHVGCIAIVLLLCRASTRPMKQKTDEQQLTSDLSSWAV